MWLNINNFDLINIQINVDQIIFQIKYWFQLAAVYLNSVWNNRLNIGYKSVKLCTGYLDILNIKRNIKYHIWPLV